MLTRGGEVVCLPGEGKSNLWSALDKVRQRKARRRNGETGGRELSKDKEKLNVRPLSRDQKVNRPLLNLAIGSSGGVDIK
jgi:hypothetical protein